jgi:hypothetical protein
LRSKRGTIVVAMTYRTKRPRTRTLLSFGVGVTLAITQLGAGCVPADPSRRCHTADGAVDEGGTCIGAPDDGGADEGGDQ